MNGHLLYGYQLLQHCSMSDKDNTNENVCNDYDDEFVTHSNSEYKVSNYGALES